MNVLLSGQGLNFFSGSLFRHQLGKTQDFPTSFDADQTLRDSFLPSVLLHHKRNTKLPTKKAKQQSISFHILLFCLHFVYWAKIEEFMS